MRAKISEKISLLAGRFRNNQLMKNTLWMLMSQGIRIVLQAAYFVIIARALGPDQYGAFIGAASLISIFAPFISLGSGSLIVKNVSREPSLFSEYWGNALFMIAVTGIILIGFVCLISPSLLPNTISPLIVFCVALADLICLRLLQTCGRAFQAVHQLKKTAQIKLLPGITRIVAAVAMILLFPEPNAIIWTSMYLLGTVVAASAAVTLVQIHLGSPKLALARIKPELLEGFYFSAGISSQTIYNNVDKAMLARLATLDAAGLYAAAYRIVDVVFVPVQSLLAASYAKFFQQGTSGMRSSLAYAKRLTPLAGAYGLAAGIGLICVAPLVPYLFGDDYTDSVQVLYWLAPLPFLKSMHYFAANSLTGAGHQGLRSGTQVLIAIFNFAGNLYLIPRYSWKGAIWATLASDGLLAVLLWAIALFYSYKEGKAATPSE